MLHFLSGRERNGFTLIEMMVTILILGILLAIAIPGFGRARESTRERSCTANLKRIQDAKEQYATSTDRSAGDSVTFTVLTPEYLMSVPECPSSGTYSVEPIGEAPTCSVPNHEL